MRRFTNCDNFRVRRRIIIANRAVVRSGKDFAVMDQHSANRNFADCGRCTCFCKGLPHELDVSFHVERENNMQKKENGIRTETVEGAEGAERKGKGVA